MRYDDEPTQQLYAIADRIAEDDARRRRRARARMRARAATAIAALALGLVAGFVVAEAWQASSPARTTTIERTRTVIHTVTRSLHVRAHRAQRRATR